MPVSVWIGVILVSAITLILAYYVAVFVKAFLQARKEVSRDSKPSERSAAFEQHRAEAAAAAANAVDSQKSHPKAGASSTSARSGGGRAEERAKGEGAEAADRDIEQALAELEGKVTTPSKARIDANSGGQSQGSTNVQHRPSGAPGDSGDRPAGGGA